MATAPEYVPAVPGAMAPAPYVVRERVQETADTWTLTLEPLACEEPAVAPGQFMMVYVFGIGEVPISVSGAPFQPGPVVLTVRAVGPVTSAICEGGVGSVLGLRGPFGSAWPVPDLGDVVVVAGGIGLAPLRPVLLHALARGEGAGRVCLLYGARTPADLLYRDSLELWARAAEVAVTVDAAGSDWAGRVGVVPTLIPAAGFDADATAFVCGPEIMMRYAIPPLAERGLANDRIFVSLERNMQCGVGHCGHCQLGPTLVCRDGPVHAWGDVARWLEVRGL